MQCLRVRVQNAARTTITGFRARGVSEVWLARWQLVREGGTGRSPVEVSVQRLQPTENRVRVRCRVQESVLGDGRRELAPGIHHEREDARMRGEDVPRRKRRTP